MSAISTAASTSRRDTRLFGQGRLLVATDNPGSPNVQAGLQKYPIYTTVGGTFGFDQNFNRLQVSGGATVDRTDYQWSKLTDGTSTSNDDRNFTQYGGIGRVSYEVMPGLKPFGEVQGDSRVHDLYLDRNGFARNSTGGYVKAGTSFEFSRLLTGEIAVGWAERTYVDPRLPRLQGFLTTASLVWTATPLTTAKFFADTQIVETTLPGCVGHPGAHLHLRGRPRFPPLADRHRQVHLRHARLPGRHQARQDLLDLGRTDLQDEPQHLAQGHAAAETGWNRTSPGASSNSTVVMLGVRVQN